MNPLLPALLNDSAGVPNMPTFVYRFRRCATFTVCVSPSKLPFVLVPNRPWPGFSVWQPLQVKPLGWPMSNERPSERRGPLKKLAPAAWSALSVLCRSRTGFGGRVIWSAKVVNAFISAVDGSDARPRSPWNATMKLLKESDERVPRPKKPFERSPRQCIGPEFTRPRSVWVVIGPFIGWKLWTPAPPFWLVANWPRLIVMGSWWTSSSGFPRSHAI